LNPNAYPELLLVILNWNSAGDTIECAESLLPQLKDSDKLIIVDNGSTDDSLERFQERLAGIEVIRNATNLGFQGGMNTGIREAMRLGSRWIMLLNSDTIASPNMLATLLSSMPPDADLVSPGIYYHEDRQRLCSTGGKINSILLELTSHAKVSADDGPIQFDFLPSHAWLVKSDVIRKVGLLDEVFFPLYYDDLDYCYRMKQSKQKLYLIPQAKIYHKVSVSVGGRNSPKERYLMARNSGFYFRKHMHIWQAPIIFFYRLLSGLLWTFRLLFKGNCQAIAAYWKGFFQGWFAELPKLI
jgi:GT2 family glycosyltransferase